MLIECLQVHSLEDVPQPIRAIGIEGLELIFQALCYYQFISALHSSPLIKSTIYLSFKQMAAYNFTD